MNNNFRIPETLPDALRRAAAGEKGVGFIQSADDEQRVSYAALLKRALGVLYFLQQNDVSQGKQLILFVSDNLQFVDGFWAALLGGVVPVPLAVGNSDEHRRKVFSVFAALSDGYLLTSRQNLQRLESFAEAHGLTQEYLGLAQKSLLVEKITDISTPGQQQRCEPQSTAFIQFSSGSTGAPKGVVLTHANLLHNINSIIYSARMSSSDVFLSWMPLTHDMGIIGFHITPLVLQVEQHLMSSDLFVRRPQLWLSKAAQHRATILSSPNFGYKHYLKTTERSGVVEMDLSAVRLIFNGAEPISLSLCEQFSATLRANGLAANAMYPVYGLAEASLAVTFPEPGAPVSSVAVERDSLQLEQRVRLVEGGSEKAARFVNVGKPIKDTAVLIADSNDREIAEGVLGRVLIKGNNVTAGYYGNEALNDASFTAEGWLDTGDLGFMLDACLYITGRSKELIIINGQNFYPHDIEALCEQVEGIDLGKVAAISLVGDAEQAESAHIIVAFKGSLEEFQPLSRKLRRVALEKAGLEITHVIPVRSIPKTTSGKFQRVALAQSLQDGKYSDVIEQLENLQPAVAGSSTADGEFVNRLRMIVQNVISDGDVGVDDNILDLGASSLKLAQIHEQLDEEFPAQIDLADLFDHPTIIGLAEFLKDKS